MTDDAARYGVFVASTNDLAEERRSVVEEIARWNVQHWDAGIVYTPLLWEISAVADARAARPQDAINGQLLAKSSAIMGIFKHRVGAAGACEEVATALRGGQMPVAMFFSTEPVPADALDEARRLKTWRDEHVQGLAIEYPDVETLRGRVNAQLTSWAKEIRREGAHSGVVEEMLDPDEYLQYLRTSNPSSAPCTLLLYNVELETFNTRERFVQCWKGLIDTPIEKVVLQLSPYKMRRLRRYLASWKDGFPEEFRERFYALAVEGTARASISTPTGTAFCLLRAGSDASDGAVLSGARIFVLSEPFSSASASRDEIDLVWKYERAIVTTDKAVVASLTAIWDQGFDAAEVEPVEELLDSRATTAIDEIRIDKAQAPSGASQVSTIQVLRERLFDPNVPSYLLDEKFFLLDWNPAFELVFPTHLFYRGEHVKEFVRVLDNVGEVSRRGAQFEGAEVTGAFDMEPLVYTSPRYRHMRFAKLASRVDDAHSGRQIGWIVALHVNEVEAFDLYESDLKAVNENHSLTSAYARPYSSIESSFPPYLELVEQFCAVLEEAGCRQVLDVGCGPGILTERLLRAGMYVTAVDANDTMLKCANERLRRLERRWRRGLSLVKANAETLHRPNLEYDARKIGIQGPYDGIAMLNSFHEMKNPEAMLSRVRTQLLQDNATLVLSLPAPENDLDQLLGEIQQYGANRPTGTPPWPPHHWRVFVQVNRERRQKNLLTRHSSAFPQMLVDAGFTIIDQRPCYLGQGLLVTARAK